MEIHTMSFSTTAGTALVPTISRLVLCAAFVSVGFNKLFKDAQFDSTQATQLQALGVKPDPVQAPGDSTAQHPGVIRLASMQDDVQTGDLIDRTGRNNDALAPDDAEPTLDDMVEDVIDEIETATDGAIDIPDPSTADADTAGTEPLPPGTYTASGLHKVTLLLDGANIPYPVYGAYLAAVTEFVGGVLLFFGFLSRIWGLGLTIAMGMAFYLTTVRFNGVFDQWPWDFAQNIPNFNQMYSQLGLGVLALGIFLTGPGPLSFDRLFFGRGGNADSGGSDGIDSAI
jgi:uncharacterized membrane protein YphA (DoxX/SURF4 family)